MSKLERALLAIILLAIAALAGFALNGAACPPLGIIHVSIGIVVGMLLFMPNTDGS